MAIQIKNTYSGRTDNTDPNYPFGKGRNVVGGVEGTGTPFEADWYNNLEGFLQGLLLEAGVTPDGDVDNANSSQLVEAVREICIDTSKELCKVQLENIEDLNSSNLDGVKTVSVLKYKEGFVKLTDFSLLNRGKMWPEVADGIINHADSEGNFFELIHQGEINLSWVGCDKSLSDCSTMIQASLNNPTVKVVNWDGNYRLTKKVEIPSNTRIKGNKVNQVIVDGDTISTPFTTVAHAENDYNAFAENIHIQDLVYENTKDLGDFRSFVTNLMWHCCNVRNVSVTGCEALNGGLWYMTHARRYFGNYDTFLENDDVNVDPAVEAGMSPTGGDLNKWFWFKDNKTAVRTSNQPGIEGKKHLVQAFRYEFCEYGYITDNDTVYGAISGWGGSAVATKGGDVQHYRRCRYVKVKGNTTIEPNGLYIINGFMCQLSTNTVERAIDVGIDFEGCFYCSAIGNTVNSSGNGTMSMFYASLGNVMMDNICLQDGSGKNIQADFNIFDRWGPNNGNELYLNTGTGFTNQQYADVSIVSGNEFIYTGDNPHGIVDVRDMSQFTYTNNSHTDCILQGYGEVDSIRMSARGNDFTATKDLESNIIKIGNVGTLFTTDLTLTDTVVNLNAVQTGDAVVELFQDANDSFYHYIDGLKIYGEGMIGSAISGVSGSVNAGRVHYATILNSIIPQGVELFTCPPDQRDVGWLVKPVNCLNTRGEDAVTTTEGARPESTKFGYIKGTKIPNSDIESAVYEGIIAEGDGFRLPSSSQWQSGETYAQGNAVFNTAGEVYYCTDGGTATIEPSGTVQQDGVLRWVRMSQRYRLNFRKFGVLSDF